MLIKRNAALLIAAVVFAGLLTGCAGSTGEEAAVPEPVVEPSPTPEPVPTPEPTPTPTPEPTPRAELDYEAQELSGTLTLSVEGQTGLEKLTDRDYETKLRLPAGTVIGLRAESEISALYMIWDEPPSPWTARSETFSEVYGGNGFIHEFEELPSGTESLEIELPQGGILCDIYAFTDGRLPDTVQLWSEPVERADILLFPTHGDDELLYFGGIMPYYAGELGLSVQVAYLTTHWTEQPRPHEQLNGLWTVGVTAYPMFSGINDQLTETFNDAARIYGEEAVIEFQVEMIRRFRPQVIVDHAESGEYGNGAHMFNTYCMKQAVELAADEDYDGGSLQQYGVWDTPKLYLHLLQENRISLDYDRPLERFGGLTAYEVAVQGYAQHFSQHKWKFFVSPKGHAYDSSSFGLYRSTVGEDVEKNDLMENLTPYTFN